MSNGLCIEADTHHEQKRPIIYLTHWNGPHRRNTFR
jgi:hypothetical protein